MAKDHFQDIIPPEEAHRAFDDPRAERASEQERSDSITVASSDKSIRNINITRKAAPADPGRVSPRRAPSRMWLWLLAAICSVVLVTLGVLYVFRRTTVTVVPHVQPVTFDQTMQFNAYPEGSAASGTLPYIVKTTVLQVSQAVTASGTTHQEAKATGTITVFNDYSTSPLNLLKTTRFQTTSGLIFRAPEAVVVPGKTGTVPGKVNISVVADAAGSQFNIPSGQRLTLPGLQSHAAMYAAVYAMTVGSTTGGFSGDVPSVSSADLSAAQSNLRSQLQQKAAEYALSTTSEGIALKPIISFSDGVPAADASGQVSITETANVAVPVIPAGALATAVAQSVTADASAIHYTLVPGSDFVASAIAAPANLGTDPITFTLSGTARLVANVDTAALEQALAGRDAAAFENIVHNFPGVDSAHALIEPFWESSFPRDPTAIHIRVQTPVAQ